MKNPAQTLLILLSIIALVLTSGILYDLNQSAQPLQLHYVQPAEQDEALSASDETEQLVLDLNTATAEQLDALPGIGPKLAQQILSYREQSGGFRDYTQLLNIDGIGQGRLEAILPYITIGGS